MSIEAGEAVLGDSPYLESKAGERAREVKCKAVNIDFVFKEAFSDGKTKTWHKPCLAYDSFNMKVKLVAWVEDNIAI